MRETTRLLMAYLPSELALLTEYMLGASWPMGPAEHSYRGYLDVVIGGHDELIVSGICAQNAKDMLHGAVMTNNIDLLHAALALGTDANGVMYCAAVHGADNEVFTILVSARADPNKGLGYAASNDDIRLLDHLSSLGAWNWDLALDSAIGNGKLRAAQWAINRGASFRNWTLYCASSYGNKPMSLVCLHNGVHPNAGLKGACSMGYTKQMKLARFFVSRGATCFDDALAEACEGGFQEAIDYALKCGATTCGSCHGTMDSHRDKFDRD